MVETFKSLKLGKETLHTWRLALGGVQISEGQNSDLMLMMSMMMIFITRPFVNAYGADWSNNYKWAFKHNCSSLQSIYLLLLLSIVLIIIKKADTPQTNEENTVKLVKMTAQHTLCYSVGYLVVSFVWFQRIILVHYNLDVISVGLAIVSVGYDNIVLKKVIAGM